MSLSWLWVAEYGSNRFEEVEEDSDDDYDEEDGTEDSDDREDHEEWEDCEGGEDYEETNCYGELWIWHDIATPCTAVDSASYTLMFVSLCAWIESPSGEPGVFKLKVNLWNMCQTLCCALCIFFLPLSCPNHSVFHPEQVDSDIYTMF